MTTTTETSPRARLAGGVGNAGPEEARAKAGKVLFVYLDQPAHRDRARYTADQTRRRLVSWQKLAEGKPEVTEP